VIMRFRGAPTPGGPPPRLAAPAGLSPLGPHAG
jgi:hypothetical protein